MNFRNLTQRLFGEQTAKEKVQNPCCPYCGYVEFDWTELMGLQDYEVDSYEMKCHKCDETYLVDKETRVRFESRKK